MRVHTKSMHLFVSMRVLNDTEFKMKEMVQIPASLLTFLLILFSIHLSAQDFESLNRKVELYLEAEEYAMAVPVLSEIIGRQPGNIHAWKKRAWCFEMTGQYEKSLRDYLKVTELNPNDPSAVFSTGILYDKTGNHDAAIRYFKKYLVLLPDDAAGPTRLSLSFTAQGLYPDSALFYGKMAYGIDPDNIQGLYALAAASHFAGNYKSSSEAVQKAVALGADDRNLFILEGLNQFFQDRYHTSLVFFKKAWELQNLDQEASKYYAALLLINNSDTVEMIRSSNGMVFLSPEKAIMKAKSGSFASVYRKFRDNPMECGLGDFLTLYHTCPLIPGKNPSDTLIALYHAGMHTRFVQESETYLTDHPAEFPLYRMLAEIYFNKKDPDHAFTNLFKYQGFMDAIRTSGNGHSPSEAFEVNDFNHADEMIHSMGLDILDRKLIFQEGRYFDLIQCDTGAGKEDIWFLLKKISADK